MDPNYNLRNIRNQSGKSSSDRINHLKNICSKNQMEKSVDKCCITSTRILTRTNKKREYLVVKTYCCDNK